MCQPYICQIGYKICKLTEYAARNRRATLCDFVKNCPRGTAAARVSDDQEMQLWTLAEESLG